MEPEDNTWPKGVIPKIKSFTPELFERKLVKRGSTWYAAEITPPTKSPEELAAPPASTDSTRPVKLLARITYNTKNWQRPSGPDGKGEAVGSYSRDNGFGHEEWLFRSEWLIDGWRYGFIEGFNRGARTYLGQPLEVTLFTRQPDKRHRLVATIYDLEYLTDEQAQDALATFRSQEWLKIMEDEIRAVGGNVGAFGDPKWAHHVLNVRYRLDNFDLYPPDSFLPDTKWFRDRHRYLLYTFDELQRDSVERTFHGRRGSQSMPQSRRLFRRGTKPVQCDPLHHKMQAKLMNELQQEFEHQCVCREQDFVDVRVETPKELIYFEIKSDLDPKAVIRQALGQLLEYAYHPARTSRRPDRLVMVGRTPLGAEDKSYLHYLCEIFNLPLAYRVVKL